MLTENCQKEDIKQRFKFVTLIIFNYDRCIEHFLYHALQLYYKLNETEAAELIKQINIYHPYGNVGTLPWDNSVDSIQFGSDVNAQKLVKLAKNIKTFTEGTDPEFSQITEIHSQVELASRVVFLGFAFHKLNIELITPKYSEMNNIVPKKCFATT